MIPAEMPGFFYFVLYCRRAARCLRTRVFICQKEKPPEVSGGNPGRKLHGKSHNCLLNPDRQDDYIIFAVIAT